MKNKTLSYLKFLYRRTILILLLSKAAYFLISLLLLKSNSFIFLIFISCGEFLPLSSHYLLNFRLYLYLHYFFFGKKVKVIFSTPPTEEPTEPTETTEKKLSHKFKRIYLRASFYSWIGIRGTSSSPSFAGGTGTGRKILNIFKIFIPIFILILSIYNKINLITFIPVFLSSSLDFLDFNYIASLYNHLYVGPVGLKFDLLTGRIPATLPMVEGTFFGFDGRKESFPLGSPLPLQGQLGREGGEKIFSISQSLEGNDLSNNTSVLSSHSEINTSNYSSTSPYPLQEKEVTISSTPSSASSADFSPSASQIPTSPSSNAQILNSIGKAMLKISNFHSLNQALKYDYIQAKFYQKGIDLNGPSLDWIIEKINKTDGTMTSVDNAINSNLNSIIKIEREAKLNSHSFKTIRPFLLGKDYSSSPTQMPNTVPFETHNNFED
uniref:Uncharacterized protein n=1 Tax=Termitomyces sp. TaxID=1916073 RepID=A0A386TYQ0_9AGAR|nr:hypothetical protein C0992_000007 [Termitomyces sp.]